MAVAAEGGGCQIIRDDEEDVEGLAGSGGGEGGGEKCASVHS
jgi:hypothetical protein